jgi:hypothetical protein
MTPALIFTAANATAMRRFCAAVDRHVSIDLPRDHLRSDPGVFIGARVRRVPRTETHCQIWRHAVTGDFAVQIDDRVRALEGAVVVVNDAGNRSITITLVGADRTEVADLPGHDASAVTASPWVRRPARDGLGGARTLAIGGSNR